LLYIIHNALIFVVDYTHLVVTIFANIHFYFIYRDGLACVPRGYLTYIAPEILRTVMVNPPILYTETEYTKEADVFAFG